MMLEGGQSFRWSKTAPSKWIGVFGGYVWTLFQKDECVDFQAMSDSIQTHESNDMASLLSNYLRLDEPLSTMYKDWCDKDPHFKATVGHARGFEGIRILNQDPVENLFSFICSSNNNIKRISSMVNNMCSLFGPNIGYLDGTSYQAFPGVESLVEEGVEEKLRKAGFGYRAAFVGRTARQLLDLGGCDWLNSLKKLPYSEAKSALMQLHGVGAKVADCVCLMSLGHMGAVPVDTHVFQIACRHYTPHLSQVKTVTDRVYNEIGDFFRKLYGDQAGWAHTVSSF
ncbi:hypothetical protein AAG570_009082 [Ranatra chinensis]|uniref:N-glycosylase/DNA lyase n=1 Tax=Ranatra chinensis TaxID=642074 RepID=A0ABD0YSU1_9HEMI